MQCQNPLQVLSSCIASRSLVSLELICMNDKGLEWAASLLRASMPRLQHLCLTNCQRQSAATTATFPDRALSDSRPTSLALHFVHLPGLGRGQGTTIPDYFTQLTHLSLCIRLDFTDLGQALQQVFISCQHLIDLTLLWLVHRVCESFFNRWTSPPASSPLKRLRVVAPNYAENNVAYVVRVMRRNLPHLSVCIEDRDWEHCWTNDVFFCQDTQTVRLTAIFADFVIPHSSWYRVEPPYPAPIGQAYTHVTFYNEAHSGETFYLWTVNGARYSAERVIFEKLRNMKTRPVDQLAGLVSVTVAEAFWDGLARSVGSMPSLKSLDILVASREPGIYCHKERKRLQALPMIFSRRMAMPDHTPEVEKDFHEWAPYSCICLALETLRLVQDPYFAKFTGERAVQIEAWQIALFINHQLGWEMYRDETMGGKLPLRLVLQRVELGGRTRLSDNLEMINHIVVEESYAPFVHQDFKTRWDRPRDLEPWMRV